MIVFQWTIIVPFSSVLNVLRIQQESHLHFAAILLNGVWKAASLTMSIFRFRTDLGCVVVILKWARGPGKFYISFWALVAQDLEFSNIKQHICKLSSNPDISVKHR